MTAMTAAAAASPLLGGYGGPGEGNQAILGSALLGGAGGGGGSSSSGSSGSGGPAGSAGSLSSPATGARTPAGHGEAESTRSGQRGSSTTSGGASGGSPRADLVLPRDDASQTASGGARALGLSAADLGYMLLALGALGLTGLITRRLARSATGPAGM
ncbi:MAG TPA: hypothetical protein VIJ66_04370 [Solirubrobacteraceae bacterium]